MKKTAQRQYMGCKSKRGKGLGNIRTGSYGVHKIDKATRRSGIRNRGLGGDAGALFLTLSSFTRDIGVSLPQPVSPSILSFQELMAAVISFSADVTPRLLL